MKAAIVGYGKMGKEVEAILTRRGHTVAVKVDPAGGPDVETVLKPSLLTGADVVIEFSLPDGVAENTVLYAGQDVPVVLGTTGWEKSKQEIETVVRESGIGFVYGSNFSIGAHLFFSLVGKAASLIDHIPEYDIMMYELHHMMKKDSPSGTALTAASRILSANSRKKSIQTEKLNRQIRPDELHVASVRGGTIPGTHTVLLDSAADSIEVTHTARSRSGFALGAVMAAEWIIGRHGFFTVDEFMQDFLGRVGTSIPPGK